MGCACVLMVGASELAARMADDRRDSLDPRADARLSALRSIGKSRTYQTKISPIRPSRFGGSASRRAG